MPKRIDEPLAKLDQDTFQDSGKAEDCSSTQTKDEPGLLQLPPQLIGPPANTASYWSMCHTSATLRAAAATPDLCTLRLAVEPSGRPVKGSELKPLESSD